MNRLQLVLAMAMAASGAFAAAPGTAGNATAPPPGPAVPVTPDNFPRAETDLHFSALVKDAGLGKFRHQRKPPGVEKQTLMHAERNMLYSDAVFDLDAGPVTITLPDAGRRYLSLQVIDEDGFTPEVAYAPGKVTLSKPALPGRYALAALRVAVDPADPKDVAAANALQDAVAIDQPGGPGAFQPPNWDAAAQATVRTGLTVLALTLPDTKGLSGPRGKTDPVRHLIGSASAWGGLPEAAAIVFEATPERNDGKTVHRLTLKDAPVDGMWSLGVYNDRGFFAPNPQNAYTLDADTAKPEPDGSVIVQFGGCDGKTANCLPTPPDWTYVLRLYRPRAKALDGSWTIPQARPAP